MEYLTNKLNLERLSKLVKSIEQDEASTKKLFEEEVLITEVITYFNSSL